MRREKLPKSMSVRRRGGLWSGFAPEKTGPQQRHDILAPIAWCGTALLRSVRDFNRQYQVGTVSNASRHN